MITLRAASAKASIVPAMGAGLAGLWRGDLPVLRPWSGQGEAGPFALACNLLVPFSNRISNGGFRFKGQFHALAPNLPGEACVLHGDAFQRAWTVIATGSDHAELTLQDGYIGPYRYAANVRYLLTPDGLTTHLSVTNRGDTTLPYGLGLHPWFPRNPQTRLQFSASGLWPETEQHLPATQTAVALRNGGAWHSGVPLPDGWINTAFSGWDGRAAIAQGPTAQSVHMTTSGFATALVYSPSGAADFFCFEPVSHPVDAHNLPGQPGLVPLAPGQTMAAAMTLTWSADDQAPNQ